MKIYNKNQIISLIEKGFLTRLEDFDMNIQHMLYATITKLELQNLALRIDKLFTDDVNHDINYFEIMQANNKPPIIFISSGGNYSEEEDLSKRLFNMEINIFYLLPKKITRDNFVSDVMLKLFNEQEFAEIEREKLKKSARTPKQTKNQHKI